MKIKRFNFFVIYVFDNEYIVGFNIKCIDILYWYVNIEINVL